MVAAAVVFPPELPRRARPPRQQDPARPRPRSRWPSGSGTRALGFGVGAASSREIDRLNIRVATALAMRRAIARPAPARRRSTAGPYRILIDGLPLPELGLPHDALVDGDARCQSIAAAAILAKTVRDRLMQRLARAAIPATGGRPTWATAPTEHHEGLSCTGRPAITATRFAPLAQLTLF